MGELLGRAAAPAAERASGDGECLGGWGEGGREGLICPPSCSNKRRPPARTAHAGRGRSEGEPDWPRARARARTYAGASAGRGGAGRSGMEGGARPWPSRPTGKAGSGEWPTGCGRRHSPCLGRLWRNHTGLQSCRGGPGGGGGSRCLCSRPSSCPSSAASGLQPSGEF